MTDIAQVDFSSRAGNSGTDRNEAGLVFRFLEADGVTPRDLTGAAFVCRITDAAGSPVLRKDTTGTVTVDLVTAEVTVPVTVADSRTLAAAIQPLTYDLERRQGSDQRTEVGGVIFCTPGANDD